MSDVSGSTSSSSHQAGQDLNRSLLIWRACLTIPHALAILSAIYRLYRRTKTRQLWRDDHFAALTLILECLYFPTLWLGESSRREALVVTSWIAQTVCPLLIWFTRVSLALSIARAIPPKQSMRRTSIGFAYLSGILGIGVTIGAIITCGRHIGKWDQTYPYQCPMPIASAIFRTCTDILADVVLVVIPFWAFWRRLKLPPISRRLIKACFAASILTFLSCIGTVSVLFGRYRAHSAVERAETGFLASVMTHLMASTALLVCNMLVVVTSVYRLFRAEKPIAAIGNPQPPPPASTTAQTSDLESNDRTGTNGTTTTTNSSLASSRISASVTGTIAESSRIELTELFDSDFSQPVSEEVADEQQGSRNSEKCSSLDDGVNDNKIG